MVAAEFLLSHQLCPALPTRPTRPIRSKPAMRFRVHLRLPRCFLALGLAGAMTLVCGGAWSAPPGAVVYEADGLEATAYADCDAGGYVIAKVSAAAAASRYATHDRFSELIAPHPLDIMAAALLRAG